MLGFVQSGMSRVILGLILGLTALQMTQMSIAMLPLTYDFVPGSATGHLEVGNITIPALDHFYPLGRASPDFTIRDERYTAHL